MVMIFRFHFHFRFHFPPFRSLGGEGLHMVMPPMLTQLELNHSAVCDASIEAVAAKVEMKEILPSQSWVDLWEEDTYNTAALSQA